MPVNTPKNTHTAAPSTAMRARGKPVGVERERDLEEQAAEQRERDQRQVALVGEAEVVADLRAEHAEHGAVELVDRVEAEQDDERVEARSPR